MFRTSSIYELLLRRTKIERFIDERCRREDYMDIWKLFYKQPALGLAVAKNYELGNKEKQDIFIEEMNKPKLNVVFGGFKGSGKTALAYWCAEELHKRYGTTTCVFKPIVWHPSILPNYFYQGEMEEDILKNVFVIYDEAQITMSSRRAMAKDHVSFSSFLTIQRHKNISAFIIQQSIEMTDINVYRLADSFIIKPLGMLQLKKEHSEKDAILQFLKFLRPLNVTETLYISADLTKILLFETPLPSFWSDKLSKGGINY